MRSNFGQFAGLPDRGHFLTNLQTFGYRLLKSTKLGIGLNLQNSLSKQLSGFFGIQDPICKHFKCLLLILQILHYNITENYNPWTTISFFFFSGKNSVVLTPSFLQKDMFLTFYLVFCLQKFLSLPWCCCLFRWSTIVHTLIHITFMWAGSRTQT